jgi:glycosyltransferase involved in cell wall biosynthesis
MDRRRVGIVIPALNEAATIPAVISNASLYGIPIVVDDGSTDGTGTLAANAGAEVVRHQVNLGYDRALNSGFAHAAAKGLDYIVTMDADGQHDPSILEPFLQALAHGADVVAGVRDRRQRLAEHVFAWVGRRRWKLQDPLCGMKAYRADIYRELGHFDSYDSIGTELVIYAARRGKRIMHVHVPTRERIGQPRFGRRFSANRRIFRALRIALASER